MINEIDPEMDVCISSEIWPRIGEYERAVNATLNAYVKPRVQAYLQEIERYVTNRLSSVRLFVTRSNGGALGLADAAKFPVHTLLSGPASGVTAAQTVSSLSKHEYLLTFDMGGTSTDVSLVRQGNPTVTSQGAVGDFPITLPVTEIEAIGAGGGSLVHLEGPAMRIGPESAGAYPGPAAFGRGGVRPTVTDAYLLCGYLNAGNFLGGAMPLDVNRAATAYDSIAGRLSVTTAEAADACLSVTTSTMVSRILALSRCARTRPAERDACDVRRKRSSAWTTACGRGWNKFGHRACRAFGFLRLWRRGHDPHPRCRQRHSRHDDNA
nr:hypothetical protein K4M19_00048 [Agrobacterium fabrum]